MTRKLSVFLWERRKEAKDRFGCFWCVHIVYFCKWRENGDADKNIPNSQARSCLLAPFHYIEHWVIVNFQKCFMLVRK